MLPIDHQVNGKQISVQDYTNGDNLFVPFAKESVFICPRSYVYKGVEGFVTAVREERSDGQSTDLYLRFRRLGLVDFAFDLSFLVESYKALHFLSGSFRYD